MVPNTYCSQLFHFIIHHIISIFHTPNSSLLQVCVIAGVSIQPVASVRDGWRVRSVQAFSGGDAAGRPLHTLVSLRRCLPGHGGQEGGWRNSMLRKKLTRINELLTIICQNFVLSD